MCHDHVVKEIVNHRPKAKRRFLMIILNGLTLGFFTPRLEVDDTMEKAADAPVTLELADHPKKAKPEIALNQKRYDPFSYAMRPYI
jgi:hypothetical protein